MEVVIKNDVSLMVIKEASHPPKKQELKRTAGVREVEEKIQLSKEETKKQIQEIINKFSSVNELRMSYDNNINQLIITVVDGNTQEVIRQIPGNESISFAKKFKEYIASTINRRV